MKYYYVDYSVIGLINGRWRRFATEKEYKEAYAETQASKIIAVKTMHMMRTKCMS